jgi:hypothetical protein
MWGYIVIGLIAFYALIKERSMLGCSVIPTTEDCDNANGKVTKGCMPNASDSSDQLFKKITFASKYSDRIVVWRQALLISLISMFGIWAILGRGIPTEYQLVVGMVVITAIVYFAFGFYKFHLHDYIHHNINASVDILRSRCGK